MFRDLPLEANLRCPEGWRCPTKSLRRICCAGRRRVDVHVGTIVDAAGGVDASRVQAAAGNKKARGSDERNGAGARCSASVREKALSLTRDSKSDVERMKAVYQFVSTQINTVDLPLGATGFRGRAAADISEFRLCDRGRQIRSFRRAGRGSESARGCGADRILRQESYGGPERVQTSGGPWLDERAAILAGPRGRSGAVRNDLAGRSQVRIVCCGVILPSAMRRARMGQHAHRRSRCRVPEG